MHLLRTYRWALLGASAGALGLIPLLAPRYGNLQTAADAQAFRETLPDGRSGRYVAAAAVDMVFAVLYGLTAVAFSRRAVGARLGALLVCLGAAADEVENVHVLRNVRDEAGVTDSAVATMRAWGTAKCWLIGTGLVVTAGTFAADRLRRD